MIRYIIDGHNFINQVSPYSELLNRDYPLCLKSLYEALLAYCSSRTVKMVLVFDGSAPWTVAHETDRVAVRFSGEHRNGDAVVIDQAEKWPGPSTLVVTQDRGIRSAAASFGCQIQSPAQFNRLLSRRRRRAKPEASYGREKMGNLTPSEVQWWKAEIERALARKKKGEG